MNRSVIEQSLDDCLLTEKEMGQKWNTFIDPIPAFYLYFIIINKGFSRDEAFLLYNTLI